MLHLVPEDYPELKQTGYYFQLTRYRKLMSQQHDHTFFELVYLLEGSLTHRINGVDHEVPQGTLLLMRPGDSHALREQQPLTNLCSLSIVADEMERFQTCYAFDFAALQSPPSIQLSMRQHDALKDICESILLVDCDQRMAYLRILLGTMIHYLVEQMYPPVQRDETRTHFLNALSRFNAPENIREGVPALLRLTNFSHAQLWRIMKRTMNTTPQQYVIDMRLSLALKLLSETSYPLESIAEQIGYTSLSHFNTLFKNRYHLSPGVFSKAHRDKAAQSVSAEP